MCGCAPFSLLLAALLLSGCGSPRPITNEERLEAMARAYPPAFLTGPAAVLLTNAAGYTARLEAVLPAATGAPLKFSGKLFVKGPHLAFAPAGSDTSFLWDVSKGSGHVLNAPLQGYAPAASGCRVTNLIQRATQRSATEVVNGETCQRQDLTLASAGCPSADASVWRTANAAAFPVRIILTDPRSPLTIELRDLQPADLADDLFLPPDELTRYVDLQSMMNELMARKSAARGKPANRTIGPPPDQRPSPGR